MKGLTLYQGSLRSHRSWCKLGYITPREILFGLGFEATQNQTGNCSKQLMVQGTSLDLRLYPAANALFETKTHRMYIH